MDANNTTDCRKNKALPECMMKMLNNEIMCDVTFIIENGEKPIAIKAHKYMLSSRSDVFHTMFKGPLPEQGDITIPDIDEDTFRDILKYIYSDEITITNDNVKEMLYASNKYMINEVKRECETVLKQTVKSEHATKALQIGYQYDLADLQKESLDYIEKNTKACLLSEHAVRLSKECLELILKSDFLDCTETDICQFVLKWGKYQCELNKLEPSGENMREAIGKILYLIRFPNVEMKFFSAAVVSSNLLTSEEMVSSYQSHFGVLSKTFPNNLRGPVSKRPTFTINRSFQVTKPSGPFKHQSLIFLSDKAVWLKGVVICLPVKDTKLENINIGIRITDDSNEEQIHEIQTTNCGDTNHAWQMTFSKPVRIYSMRNYTIQMDDINLPTYYVTECHESVTDKKSGVTMTFKNSQEIGNGTNIKQGQFWGFSLSV